MPIDVNPAGSVRVSSALLESKTESGILLTLSPITTDFKFAQLMKAPDSSVVTESGTTTLPRLLHSRKACDLIVFTLQGMTMDEIPHPLNASAPIKVTPYGMATSPSFSQPRKVPSSILVTPDGRFTLVSAVQPLKAFLPTEVTVDGSVTLLIDVLLSAVANA